MYAVAKIMGTQFSSTPSLLDKSIGELSGFELTWYYFGFSFWYGVFIAASQILAAFLLFFRQTTRLGIVIYLSIMANILVLDFAYDIRGAKGMASVLTLVATFVLLSEYKSFFQFFFQKPPLFENQHRPTWMNTWSRAKFVFVPLLLIGLFTMSYVLKERIMTKNEFYGAWQPVNYQNWQRIYFQEASTYSIRMGHDLTEIHSGKYTLDREKQQLTFSDFVVPEAEIDVLNPKASDLTLLMEVKYEFTAGGLVLQNDSLQIEAVKLR